MGFCDYDNKLTGSHKRQVISKPAERFSGSKDELRSVKLIILQR
jgi:hypothetical protein